jgi:hypothetical protein
MIIIFTNRLNIEKYSCFLHLKKISDLKKRNKRNFDIKKSLSLQNLYPTKEEEYYLQTKSSDINTSNYLNYSNFMNNKQKNKITAQTMFLKKQNQLMNKIRKEHKYYEIIYMAKNNNNLHNNDQTIINYILYPNIGLLPFKYGIFNFDSIFDIKYLYLNRIRQKLNITELISAFITPSIMHYTLCVPKLWYSNSKFVTKYTRSGTINELSCKKYHDIWIEYAKKTLFYKEIIKFYKIKI